MRVCRRRALGRRDGRRGSCSRRQSELFGFIVREFRETAENRGSYRHEYRI